MFSAIYKHIMRQIANKFLENNLIFVSYVRKYLFFLFFIFKTNNVDQHLFFVVSYSEEKVSNDLLFQSFFVLSRKTINETCCFSLSFLFIHCVIIFCENYFFIFLFFCTFLFVNNFFSFFFNNSA